MNANERDNLETADPAESELKRRLRRLRACPVDLSRLRAGIEREIPRRRENVWHRNIKLIRAVAASIVLGAVVVLLVMSLGTQSVLASADRMAEIHRNLATGTDASVRAVSSIEDAQQTLDRAWSDAPNLPAVPSDHQVMACCVHALGSKRIACVVMTVDGQKVSIAVGESRHIRLPEGPRVTLAGQSFTVQTHEGLNMLMTEQGSRFICIMSPLSLDKLEAAVGQLRL